ncbi:MAG TPA: class I tRNA ligase family protein, partial [Xanthobacteraceae bacterium]
MSADKKPAEANDYSDTLFLPQTDFPMRAGLPQKEPELLARWERLGLYRRLRTAGKGRARFILHDGPPYANGNVHIGTALNKILKDIVTRTHQMAGWDSNYVPGWDCHGLPIEWKVEEEYRAKGKDKDKVPIVEFRRECREFAEKWIGVQKQEFRRLGVEGDWETYYTTMSFDAEAAIARELMKFAMSGQLYRGSKPVMWSVVEKTALAEAEVEYEDYTSDTVWVKFPVLEGSLSGASVVVWTTTPWTIPGNRAISFSGKISYGLYEVMQAPADNWARAGDKLIVADKLASDVMKAARVGKYERRADVDPKTIKACVHPFSRRGYEFAVPLLEGGHVTDEDGTGFVHTAPGHGRDDFDIWTANTRALQARGIDPTIPYTVDENGFFTKDAPGFEGKRVIDDKGKKGDANDAVIKALT